MKILLLSPYPRPLLPTLVNDGRMQITTTDAPVADDIMADWIIAYGYKHILREPLLSRFAGRIINLHISALPWNRGYDANFWSWLEHTPKGVTIHQIDAGIDTGPILAQEPVVVSADETLKTSYWKLRRQIENLFARTWSGIREGRIEPQPQQGKGSFHLAKERLPYFAKMPLGWYTPVSVLETWQAEDEMSKQFIENVRTDIPGRR